MRKVLYLFLLVLTYFNASTQNTNTPVKPASLSCNNWLHIPYFYSHVIIGDLDVPGNKITVEANFDRMGILNPTSDFGFIVSKHTGPGNCNYFLSPNGAGITTSDGYFTVSESCPIQRFKTYHVAMVYDGTTLKFYRNGFLQDQVPATGTLVLNDYDTYIGRNANPVASVIRPFLGYLNEIKIWNIARTQSEIRSYMDNSLPSPATQPGLLAYYVFDDFTNKQGNANWNGTPMLLAISNTTNDYCAFVADSCSDAAPTGCNNWLLTQAPGQSVKVGDLDISGNQVTVEAMINRTVPYTGSYIYGGDIVSKHTDPNNVNYLLRSNNAEITTTDGFFQTPHICELELHKTYHVAMVYDGAALKFYRNGFLMSQVPATGNLFQNNDITTIGDWANYISGVGTNFLGNINEVRIWNIARTQSQLRSYMNAALPSPTMQPGLQAYYTFDDLVNKQGNTNWDGTLTGAASINAPNPECNFTADSCRITTNISNIINDYTPVLAFNPCKNSITVEDATHFNVGDTVLLIQMKGAIIDSTNTSSFGTITDYKNAGNYEFNYVKSRSGNIIELKNKLTRQYDLPFGKVQLVRVPYYNNANISNTLTCLPWNGSVGGVLVFHVKDTLKINANLDVSAKGFRGGINGNNLTNTWNCFAADYSYAPGNSLGAPKGEGITTIINTGGRGALANGGGGGQDHNSGGAGGGNGNLGGFGGYQYEACVGTTPPYDNRGMQGKKLDYSNTQNRIFLGGGGGSGHANNAAGFEPDGANGGGIIIVQAGTIINQNFSILSNGGNAVTCTANIANNNCNEAMGGGGAGGTVLLKANNYVNNLPVKTNGGAGADVSFSWPPAPGNPNKHGPGGGGGGGVIWVSQSAIPGNISTSFMGGINGLNTGYGNDPWGATAGQNGVSLQNLILPIDTSLFKKNIDSVRIKDSSTACRAFDFHGFGYTNSNPISSWHWNFGDAGSASTQNASHTYSTNGTFNVTLVVTDINGCKDSIVKPVTSNTLTPDAGPDTTFCTTGTVTVQLHGTNAGGSSINWTPAGVLNNSTSLSPVATINTTTTFYLNATAPGGCTGKDSVTIYVKPVPVVNTIGNTTLCESDSVQLITSGATTYHWQPGSLVTDSLSANPWHIGTGSNVTLIVTGTNSQGCPASDTVTISGLPKPNVKSIGDTILCNNAGPITLVTTGAVTYSWSPAANLDNPNSSGPIFNGTANQTYYVTGTAANGCKAKDTVNITIRTLSSFVAPPGKTLCKGDTVHLNGNNGTVMMYLWSPGDHLSSTTIINPIANPDISTLYSVTVTDTTCNLDTTFKVLVNVKPLPAIIAQRSNDINCAFKSSQLTATGGIQYTWDASPSLSNTTIANPVATPTTNTIYTVTGTDNNGCKNKDTVAVLVKNGFTSYGVYNSFTPNGDGLNDCFGIKHWGDASSIYFIIYNRWGEKVFQTTNPNDCWDGKYKGVPSEAGNYVFYVKGFTPCGWVERKGNVMLIR